MSAGGSTILVTAEGTQLVGSNAAVMEAAIPVAINLATGVESTVAMAMTDSAAGGMSGEPTVLQSGGNTISARTAQELNRVSGLNAHRRDWGRALESLKNDLGLRNDHHGRIMSNGDYMDDSGNVLGNIIHYMN